MAGVMMAVVAAGGGRLDAGSVGLALARRWTGSGERVLFVDADTTGSRLAERLGEAEHAAYSPAVRGVPSLMAAREPVTLASLSRHSYSLEDSAGSLWGLFAPTHPKGGEHAARWLADRCDAFQSLNGERRVIISASLTAGGHPVAPLLRAASIVVVMAPVESLEEAATLARRCSAAGLAARGSGACLIVEGASGPSDDEIETLTDLPVVGRLPVIDDARVLRPRGGTSGRAFAAALAEIAGRVEGISQVEVADRVKRLAGTDGSATLRTGEGV